jgi:uncharacterized membrane protein
VHDNTKEYGMDVGPVDVVILSFPGNEFNGRIAPAIVDLVERGVIRLLDVLFVTKDVEGNVGAMALADLGEDLGTVIAVSGDVPGGMLDDEDVADVAASLEPNSSAAMLVWENTWAATVSSAIADSGGQVVDYARVPVEAVRALLTEA